MKVYVIECEWGMGFKPAYATKERAMKDINNINWVEDMEYELEELFENGLLEIVELDVTE